MKKELSKLMMELGAIATEFKEMDFLGSNTTFGDGVENPDVKRNRFCSAHNRNNESKNTKKKRDLKFKRSILAPKKQRITMKIQKEAKRGYR